MARWAKDIEEFHRRLGARSYRSGPRCQALACLKGQISSVERKSGWQLAKQIFNLAQEEMPRPAKCSACSTIT